MEQEWINNYFFAADMGWVMEGRLGLTMHMALDDLHEGWEWKFFYAIYVNFIVESDFLHAG